MYEPILLVLLVALIFLVPIIIARLERRKTWPYIHQYEFGNFQLSSTNEAYIAKCRNSAEAEGFTYLERRYDGKGKKYKIVYEFLISSDFNTLAIISAGTLINIPVNNMWFYSKDVHGKCFVTLTDQNAVEYDLTGFYKDSLILTTNFGKAFEHHLKCITQELYHIQPYAVNNEIDDFRHMRELKIDHLYKNGWIKYVGENKDCWKYTIKGAVKLVTCQTIQSIIRFPKSLFKGIKGSKKTLF